MSKNIAIAALIVICSVLSVFVYIQVQIAQNYVKMAGENMERAVKCREEYNNARKQFEARDHTLVELNQQLQMALEDARAARMEAMKMRK